MRLAAKFVLTFLAGTVTVLFLYGVFAVQREHALFERDIERDTRLIGRSLKSAIENVWRDQGEEKVLELIAQVDREEEGARVRWVAASDVADRLGDDGDPHRGMELLKEGSEISLRSPGVDHEEVSTLVLIHQAGRLVGGLEVSESLQPAEVYVRASILRFAALAAVISLLVAMLAIPIGVREVGAPLSRLVDKTRRAGQGDFSGELQIRGRDELTELAEAVNSMCADLVRLQQRIREESEARLAALEQLRHEDRLKTVGRLASGVAHELGTPLNVVGGRAGLITRGKLDNREIVEAATIIKQQADVMTAIVRQLLDFARRRAPEKVRVDLVPLVRQSLELLQTMAVKQQVNLALVPKDEMLEADVDVSQLQQVVTNLVLNAIQASAHGDRVRVWVEAREESSKRWACIVVQDEGEGISSADLPHIFEPFFTTKVTGEGTGLGLSLVYGIVQEHGGKVEVSSTAAEGTRFEVYLPVEGRRP